jgi:hypothetical protein
VQRTPEEDILRREKYALNSKAKQENEDQKLGLPTDPHFQEARTKRIVRYERELSEVKRLRDEAQEKIPASPIENPIAQRVLTEAFCVNRLKEIRQLAGDSKLKDFTKGYEREVREEEISCILKRFRRENVDGDPPYFCVSAEVVGMVEVVEMVEIVDVVEVIKVAGMVEDG